MKTAPASARSGHGSGNGPSTGSPAAQAAALPNLASLAALRAWHERLPPREAVTHYLNHVRDDG